MLTYSENSYKELQGKIDTESFTAAKCVSQCTGCMCNCRCACSGISFSDVEWEEI